MRTVVAGVLVVAVAACTRSPVSPAAVTSAAETSGATSDPTTTSATPTAPETPATPVVNGRITSVQRHLRSDVGSYDWLAFDIASDLGLHVSYRFCRDCRPRGIEVARFTVVGPDGRVARLTCSDGPLCRSQDHDGTAATLGPGPDEVTVEAGGGTLSVIGHDGALRRTIDLTGPLARRDDIAWLAWAPDGSRLAVLTDRALQGSDIWIVEGDDAPELAYSGNNPWMLRPAWSPDGQRLLVDQMVPLRSRNSFRSSGADVVVFHRSSAGSSPALTPQVLYRSDRGFDNAGNLAWSPDGTRIAVRTKRRIVEISAEDGRVLARHPHNRADSGWLVWLRESDAADTALPDKEETMQVAP